MGRRYFYALIAGTALSIAPAEVGLAQGPGQPGGPSGGARPIPRPPGNPFRQAKPRWRDMSPADRQHFQSNMERWRQMPLEQRQELRERAIRRQERLKRETEAAIRDSGLQLEAERRAQFEQRYIQERKRIEQSLRQELQEKRQREMAPVVERLKKEFAQPQNAGAPTSSAAPSAPSSSPK